MACETVIPDKSGTLTEFSTVWPSPYNIIIEFFCKLTPGFGVWFVTKVEFSSPEEEILQVNPALVKIFLASVIVLLVISGTVIKFWELLSVLVLSEGTPI